jgi:hypothetical protein
MSVWAAMLCGPSAAAILSSSWSEIISTDATPWSCVPPSW